MAKNVKNYRQPTHEEISALAHRMYEMEGRPEGKSMEHWLRAEVELIAERKALAASAPTPAPQKNSSIGNSPAPSMPVKNAPPARQPNWQPSTGQPVTRN